MTPSIVIDTVGFDAMVVDFKDSLGRFGVMVNTDKVLRLLIGRVVQACIRRTPMAKKKSIQKHFRALISKASAGGVAMSINNGERGGVPDAVWYGESPSVSSTVTAKQRAMLERRVSRGGKVWVRINQLKNPGGRGMLQRYQALDAFRLEESAKSKARLAAALGARGLARNSWLQIAQRLGIPVGTVTGGDQVAAARPSTGSIYESGRGIRVEAASQLYYEIMNSFPFSRFKIAGASILSRAIQGELGYFRNNIKHGVFQDLAAIAKKYKGIAVT